MARLKICLAFRPTENTLCILVGMVPGSKRVERGLTILELLRPHKRMLWLGILAICGESVADLLEPWPLKIVLDNVIGHKQSHGWLFAVIRRTAGTEPHQILIFACVGVALIALLDAACTYSKSTSPPVLVNG